MKDSGCNPAGNELCTRQTVLTKDAGTAKTRESQENLLKNLMKERTEPRCAVFADKKEAAVLVPLLETKEGYDLVFEVRSDGIAQGGEICFPGGSLEAGETPEEGACRECSEELLLSRKQIRTAVPLHCIMGPGGRKVTSVLGILEGYEGTFSREEVAGVFRVPLSFFLTHPPKVYEGTMEVSLPADFPYGKIPGGRNYPFASMPRSFLFYETKGGVIWGMTATLLSLFVQDLTC